MNNKCLNIIVFYNNYFELKEYIDKVIRIGNECVDILIVVNRDDRNEIPKIKDEYEIYEFIHVVDYKENVGYLNAFFYSLNSMRELDYKFYILSNTDIDYLDDSFFKKLLLNGYQDDIGCIAPSIYAKKTDSFSNPHYLNRIPKKKYIFLKFIFSNFHLASLYLRIAESKAKRNKQNERESMYVYSPHGSYMIFTREFISKVKGYTYGAVLYSEEACVGELLLRYRLKCFYDASLKIEHTESTVTGSIKQKNRFNMWKKSIEYILSEFY